MFTSKKKKHLLQIEKSAAEVALASVNAEVYYQRLLGQINTTLQEEEAAASRQQAMIEVELKQLLDELHKESNVAKDHINEEQFQRVDEIRSKAIQELLAIDTTLNQRVQEIQDESTKAMATIQGKYDAAVANVHNMLVDVEARLGNICKPWNEILTSPYVRPETMAEAVRFGTLSVQGASSPLEFPALLPFLGGKNIIIKAAGTEAKAKAVQALQNIILRLLYFSPPSELRLMLIDPVGLGNNLAVLLPHEDKLQVADTRHGNTLSAEQFIQQMVGSKVWVDSADIDKRLAEMSVHQERVIQKYLNRSEINSIEDYNREAGESEKVAFKLLAVVNFPINFNDQTANRLVSIADNGPRCGVYTLITWDMDQKPLHGFNPGDLECKATILRWENDRFIWEDPDFQQAVLTVEGPPPLKETEQITQTIWQRARLVRRNPLPFSKIVPKPEFHLLWDEKAPQTTQFGLRVPIGQTGAQCQQFLELGQDSAHHVLLTGQTGTGKSNLLHIIICSLATFYSPDELELYLIDFKEGVEFKAYAPTDDGLGALPHARVIAIKSDREFGLSCLKALYDKMAARNALFIEIKNCSNIVDYRTKTGKKMPRILLLVDEFQIFFEASDQGSDWISDQAKFYLDSLASLGRNVGIHMMLATQTLQRSKSIPSGLMTQIAVRIALKASTEQDSVSMIGNKEAYTLLERTGEAFYNSTNGLPHNNPRFQAPYLPGDERDSRLHDFKLKHPNRDVVIFEGGEEANIEDSTYWRELLALPTWPVKSRGIDVHLGLPVAIKAPTSGRFFHQAGRNLLVVGRDEKAVVGILTAIVCDLAAQRPASDLRFLLWNLNHFESPYVDLPVQIEEALSSYRIDIGKTREIPEMIHEVAAIIDQRLAAKSVGNPEIFIIGFGLQRSRDLLPDSASRTYEPTARIPEQVPQTPTSPVAVKSAGTGTMFAKILREGPAVGVHMIGWWDSYIALNKVVDRNLLREFGMRIVLNMSKDDSRNLVDENDAAKLAPHRALFWEEEESVKLEKFIPFAPPTQEWLTALGENLRSRIE
ncbi:MAG: hypothetical protein J0665_14475 [Deltaproteobacteria bacterium]|nr:hypothetical protein [Deltaproteobacteria bacterium]